MDEWKMVGPFREGAYSVRGPNGEKIFIEIEGEGRECQRTRYIAEQILELCKEASR